jgi:hypothetical protein
MKRTYVYLHHQGFDFYLSDQELLSKERFCTVCDEEDVLLGTYESEDSLADKLRQLFAEGYDLLPCKEYDRIKEKYCPGELR